MRTLMRLALCGAFLLVSAFAQITGGGGGGSGTVSGLSANCVPKAATATTITGCSAMTDNGSMVSSTLPFSATSLSLTGSISGTISIVPASIAGSNTIKYPSLTGWVNLRGELVRRRGWCLYANGSSTTSTNLGDTRTNSGSSPIETTVAGSTSAGPMHNMQTKSSTPASGDVAGYSCQPFWKMGKNVLCQIYFKMVDWGSGSQRVWNGCSDQTGSTMVGADVPAAGNYAGIRCSTGASDANFMYFQRDGSTATTATSTGVACDANPHWLEIIFDDSGAVSGTANTTIWYIDGAQVATSTSNRPTAASLIRPVSAIATLTTAQRSVQMGLMYAEEDMY